MESVLLETDTTIDSHDSEFVGVDEVHLMTPPELGTVDGSADERNEDDDSISETGSECESLCDSDSSDDDIFDDARTDTFQVKVRLDCFHAMNRINRTLLKAHGAYKPFMARLRDAIFLISAEDMNTVVAALKAARWTDEQIQAKKKYDWGFFLKHCRRHIPHKEELLKRFDKVCDAFHDMLDSKTQKPLFHTALMVARKKDFQFIVVQEGPIVTKGTTNICVRCSINMRLLRNSFICSSLNSIFVGMFEWQSRIVALILNVAVSTASLFLKKSTIMQVDSVIKLLTPRGRVRWIMKTRWNALVCAKVYC
jgi:hypothetical protein